MPRWKLPVLVGLLLVVAAVGSGTADAATTRVWTGAVSLNWNTAGNWDPPGVPVDGDSVVIGAAAFGKTLTNNRPADLNLASLTINTSTVITGNRLGISSAMQVAQTDATLDLPIILRGDVQASVAPGARLFMRARLSPMGTVALDMAGHTLSKSGTGDMEFDGDLSGLGTLAASRGTVSFLYPVTFGGTISLGPDTRALLTVLGNGTGFCGSAPNTAFVLSGATLSAACVVSIRSVSGTGELEMFSSDSRLFIAGGSGAVFDGKITGAAPSAILCCSNGGQTFRGASTFTGNVFVDSGALTLQGANFPAASQFTVQGSGRFRSTLAGYGTFGGTILTDGNLALVPLEDRFGLARFPDLQFAPDVLVNYEIRGPTPGTGFTQIVMSGQVVLDSAVLRLDFNGYAPAAGQSITLVRGATALLDTFHDVADGKNLAEGATFTAKGPLSDSGDNALKFRITYKGGAGHDVVITSLTDPATPTPTPDKFKRFVAMLARDN